MTEMERFTVLRHGTGGEKVKIGSGIYIDGGMLVRSEYLMRELDVTYILERDGKEWTVELLGQTLIGLDDPPYVGYGNDSRQIGPFGLNPLLKSDVELNP